MRKIFNVENLIYLTVFLLPAYLIRFQILGVPTNISELLILLTAFVCFSQPAQRQLLKKYVRGYVPAYVRWYVLSILLILAGLGLSIAVNENYRVGLGILKSWFILPLLFALTILVAARDKSVKEKILPALYFSAGCVGLIALFYFCTAKLTYDGRLAAFYLSPNHLAMFLAPGLVFGIWYLVFSIKRHTARYWHLLSLIIIGTAFYLTYSYAAWIAVILSFALVILIKNKNSLTVVGYGLLLALIFFLLALFQWPTPKFQDLISFHERSSLASRIMIWKSAVKITLDNPLYGIGPGNFQNKYLEYQKYFPPYLEWAVPQPHNLYLAFWLQSGISGLIGFLLLLFFWIKNLAQNISPSETPELGLQNAKQKNSPLTSAVLGIMFYFLLHGLLDTPYWKNDLALIFWIVFALGLLSVHSIANQLSSQK